MEKQEKTIQELMWATRIAEKYDIFPSTVLGVKKNLVGNNMYRDRVYVNRTRRTEEFFELYFEGVRGE